MLGKFNALITIGLTITASLALMSPVHAMHDNHEHCNIVQTDVSNLLYSLRNYPGKIQAM